MMKPSVRHISKRLCLHCILTRTIRVKNGEVHLSIAHPVSVELLAGVLAAAIANWKIWYAYRICIQAVTEEMIPKSKVRKRTPTANQNVYL